ncbi:MAG: hypothetical protein NTX53_10055 [candidate division WOR-3 bacterium]|nr:hypothetical protein [candidate division WOR-3 bacterium]
MPAIMQERKKRYGIVAVLDALGAASYGDAEVKRFMGVQERVLTQLDEKISNQQGEVRREAISLFTFNDTILIAYATGEEGPVLPHVTAFFRILRRFFLDSLIHGLIFRGSVAIGAFYVNKKRNVVMGQAVTDAAAWYDKAEWIGIHATPRTTIAIQMLLEGRRHETHEMLDYDVPMRNGRSVPAKVVDWPAAFFFKSMTPCRDGEGRREKLLRFLSGHVMPLGTETKYSNTIDFFDHSAQELARFRSSLKEKRKHR